MKKILFIILILFLIIVGYFFVGSAPKADEIIFGVNFSQKHSRDLSLDWQENYSALLEDLGVKRFKIAAHWDLLEPKRDEYNFTDLDWQINRAEQGGAKVVLVMGMKTSRWPECHLPEWAQGLSQKEQKQRILKMLEAVVLRYQEADTIIAWQVENEPFFPFGACPWVSDQEFLKKEIELVKSLDSLKRPVIVSDSGEGSFWFRVASLADIVGTTMYKKVWLEQFETYLTYPFPPVFYARKAKIIEVFFSKEVIGVELQAEPWGPKLLYDLPLSEQEKTMNLPQFRENIAFAKKTGFKEFYLWGAEWWYWMKVKNNQPEIWQEAGTLF